VDLRKRPFPNLPHNNSYPVDPSNLTSLINRLPNDIIDGAVTLPRNDDMSLEGERFDPNNKARTFNHTFIYHLPGDGTNSIRLQNNEKLILGATGEETIKIYANQEIELRDNSTIELADDGDRNNPNFTKAIFFADSNLILRGQDSTKHKTTDFQVYVYGEREIRIVGNNEFKGFIFGPSSQMFLTGDTSDPDLKDNNLATGAIWVRRYVPNGGDNVNNFRQMLTKDDMNDLEISAEYDEVKDLEIGPIQSWKQIAWEEE
jgi:hypothetical protein